MTWILENWMWILFAIGAILLLRRGHRHGGLGGLLGRHGHRGGHRDYGEWGADQGGRPRAEAAIDPVSGNAVRVDGALTSVFQGRNHYFQSGVNRALFESSPERHVGATSGHAAGHRPHRRHGC